MKFKHFTIEEREKIQELLWQKASIRFIVGAINRIPSSVSREIKKNIPLKRIYITRDTDDHQPHIFFENHYTMRRHGHKNEVRTITRNKTLG